MSNKIIEDCIICYEYGSEICHLTCCNKYICKKCIDKLGTKCPHCRRDMNITKEIMYKNVGYKIDEIINTLLKYGVYKVQIDLNEFKEIGKYFEDEYQCVIKDTYQMNVCICSTRYCKNCKKSKKKCKCETKSQYTSSGYYGSFNTIVVDLKKKIYYEYYVCSQCTKITPLEVWDKMLNHGKKYDSNLDIKIKNGVTKMRDKFLEYEKWDDPDWKYIEKILYKNFLVHKRYINVKEVQFLTNLINICSDKYTSYGNGIRLHSEILIKYIDYPKSLDYNDYYGYLLKFIKLGIWDDAMKQTGFIGLYGCINLWNKMRNPDIKDYEHFEAAVEFQKNIMKDMENYN